MLRDDPEEYNRIVQTMMRRQSRGGNRQGRSVNRIDWNAAADVVEDAEVVEEDSAEVEAGATGRGVADAEANPVDGVEAAAEVVVELVDLAGAEDDRDGDVNNEEEDGTAEEPTRNEENAEEGADRITD